MSNDAIEFYMPTVSHAFHVLEEWMAELTANGYEPDIKAITINPSSGRAVMSARVRLVWAEDARTVVEGMAEELRDLVQGTWSSAVSEQNRVEWTGHDLNPLSLEDAAGFRVLRALPNAGT